MKFPKEGKISLLKLRLLNTLTRCWNLETLVSQRDLFLGSTTDGWVRHCRVDSAPTDREMKLVIIRHLSLSGSPDRITKTGIWAVHELSSISCSRSLQGIFLRYPITRYKSFNRTLCHISVYFYHFFLSFLPIFPVLFTCESFLIFPSVSINKSSEHLSEKKRW